VPTSLVSWIERHGDGDVANGVLTSLSVDVTGFTRRRLAPGNWSKNLSLDAPRFVVVEGLSCYSNFNERGWW